jgi:hypothetical protein
MLIEITDDLVAAIAERISNRPNNVGHAAWKMTDAGRKVARGRVRICLEILNEELKERIDGR